VAIGEDVPKGGNHRTAAAKVELALDRLAKAIGNLRRQ
jgi:hypothetical protein